MAAFVTCAQRAIAVTPRDARLYSYLGDVMNNLKHFDRAVEMYRKGIKIDKYGGVAVASNAGHTCLSVCVTGTARAFTWQA